MKVILSVSTVLLLLSFCAVSESSKCPPGDSYEKDCNTCSCIESGIYVCTLRACYDGPTFPDTDVPSTSSTVQDLPTTLSPQSIDKQVCTPHDTKMQNCNRCTCTANGLRWKCTRRACPRKSNIPVNGEGFTCTPNESFKEDCNSCTCDSSGKLARCTSMACEPKERRRRSNDKLILNPANSQLATQTQKSLPSSTTSKSSIQAPSTVKPSVSLSTVGSKKDVTSTTTASTASTTTKAPYNPKGTADRNVTPEELKSPDFTCVPSLSFKVECNTCWCAANGKETRFCTRIACVKPKQ